MSARPFGIRGKLLRVDLSTGKAWEERLDHEVYRKFVGGRGLAAYILWRELGGKWRSVDPLGPENLLIAMTGPLTGYYPGIKLVVSGKSPQSNGVIGSALSSELGYAIKAAGYDGVVVSGASPDPVYIYVHDDGVEIRDASRLWGRGGLELVRAIREEAGPDAASIYIGPAGEKAVRTAVVMSRWFHASGYGGYGAVMGSKKLKAIVVRSERPLPRVADPKKFLELRNAVIHKVSSRTAFREWGTPVGIYETGNEASSEPVRNWAEEWHDARQFSHLSLQLRHWYREKWADWGCPLACMKASVAVVGGRRFFTDGPDYEMAAYLGSNLGIFDAEKVVALSAIADELGLCGIQTGNAMAFAAELFEAGLLTKEDVGYEIKWGDFEAFARLMEDIANMRGIGKVLAQGTYRAALEIARMKGIDPGELLKRAVQVKGVAIGAHGIRSGRDYPQPIAYAASVQAGDHTSVAGVPAKSEESESWSAFLDSAVVCMFTAVEPATMVEYLNAVTGWGVTLEEVYGEIGPRILSLQRLLLLLGGPDATWDPRKHDDNPPRFYEPLPSGPYRGSAASREEVRESLRKYYEELGWDELGIPRDEVLEALGLGDAVEVARALRRELGRGA
ncbi:MAG: aldehyde ferredoxin oxidoreductase C-terminal domain-containing protein [Desulfurococcaceae archaeon]